MTNYSLWIGLFVVVSSLGCFGVVVAIVIQTVLGLAQ